MRRAAAVSLVGVALLAGVAVALFPGVGADRAQPVVAGSDAVCGPPALPSPHPGMVWVPGGHFTMGSDSGYPEEGPAHARSVDGFWMDRTEVTNRQFAEFVAATGYRTLAERGIADPSGPDAPPRRGSAVFVPLAPGARFEPGDAWWRFVDGANWREPYGPGSSLAGLEEHPVVHVAWEDAVAYARWKGRELPSEAQFEYAAQSSAHRDDSGTWTANTWQGEFPYRDEGLDGHVGTAPVACYPANGFGLYDLIGNVWEWTASAYHATHDAVTRESRPDGHDPQQPGEPVAVIKGGSHLCSANFCMRYRPEARQGHSRGLGTSHIGFRTVLNAAGPAAD